VVPDDDQVRRRIVSAAAELMRREGFSAVTLERTAKEAGVRERVARRLFGDLADLRAEMLDSTTDSDVVRVLQRAAEDPAALPPLSVLVESAHRVLVAPRENWATADLEALARASDDPQVAELAHERLAPRVANVRTLVAHAARTGGLDAAISQEALTHFVMALSVGMATLHPAAPTHPTPPEWDGLIARIGAGLSAPEGMPEGPTYSSAIPWRVRVDIPDRPGALARLVGAFGVIQVRAVEVRIEEHHQDRRTVFLALLAPEAVSADVLLAAASSVGTQPYVSLGDPADSQDIVTRILDGATFLVKHPEQAPAVVAELVGGQTFEVIDATSGLDEGSHVLRLQWTPDRHVLIQRDWGPFTPTERVRASALLRLSAAIARMSGDDDQVGWIDAVRAGTVWIRLARPEDADAVARMHDRCSDRTRYQRYFSLQEWRDVQLRRLAGGHRGATLVVMSRDGQIVGLGNVFPESPEDPHTAEIALLVEDAYQGGGIGRALLARMLQVAPRMGFTSVVAHLLAENAAMHHLLDATGLGWTTRVSEGVAHMTATLAHGPELGRA
jgi:AcrR family transcriptional regulator/RimJ/RimL family protein N-acetyltransferase